MLIHFFDALIIIIQNLYNSKIEIKAHTTSKCNAKDDKCVVHRAHQNLI